MEYLVAALVLLFTVSYAVVIAVNIDKGKSWALEIARAVSMLDPESASRHLRDKVYEREDVLDPPAEKACVPESDRLAA